MKRLALIVVLVGICTGISQADVPASQRQALIDLYNSTNGSNWYDAENWRNGDDTDFNDIGTECTWFGVTCNGTGDSVTGLNLNDDDLSGSIPASIEDLADLQNLELSSNQLTGSIPPELGNISALGQLQLSFNQLSGSIPSELANLTALADGSGLDLRWNALHSEDATLIAFLDTKQEGGDWQGTQTVAPADLQATLPTSSSVVLEWTPISYTADVGRYMVFADPPFWDDVIFFDGFESHDTKWWGIGMPWVTTTDKTDT